MGKNQSIISDSGLVTVTDFYEGTAAVNPQALGKAGRSDRPEVFAVIIKNRLNNLDNSANAVSLIVGTGAGCIWPLLPGEESPLIHCRNLNDVFVRIQQAIVISEVLGGITAVTIAAAGLGYAVFDVLTVAGGGGDARVQVASVNGLGAITALNIITPGTGYAAALAVALGGGTGAGATVNITAVLNEIVSTTFPFIVYRKDVEARRC